MINPGYEDHAEFEIDSSHALVTFERVAQADAFKDWWYHEDIRLSSFSRMVQRKQTGGTVRLMPKSTSLFRKTDKQSLFEQGCERVTNFCEVNNISIPPIHSVSVADFSFGTCAYYRPDDGIVICIPKCSYVGGEIPSRNWNWPGATTDREPFGVLAHELGHHCDWLKGDAKGSYFSNYSIDLQKEIGDKPLTSYCPNPAEWFAEMFRLFVTNHKLLEAVRPNTHKRLIADWKPVSSSNWERELGGNCPIRIVENLRKKINA